MSSFIHRIYNRMTILARSKKIIFAPSYEMSLPVVRLKDAFGIVSV
jgi:hypothetical protein